MTTTQTQTTRLISCVRPRSAYQVIRYVDGPKLMLTCTRRGKISVHELYITRLAGGAWVEKSRKLDAVDAAEALDRAVRFGYDPIAIGDELRARAAKRASR